MFSCYTLVYVCKTEVHATIQFAFNSELSFSPTKGILRNYEAVFISKILFTVQFNYVCLSFSYFRLLFNCLLVIQLCSFVFQLCLLVVQSLYLIMPTWHSIMFDIIFQPLLLLAFLARSLKMASKEIQDVSDSEGKEENYQRALTLLNEAVDILRSPCTSRDHPQ